MQSSYSYFFQSKIYVFLLSHYRVHTLERLLSPYCTGKKKILVRLVNRAHRLLHSICFVATQMDSEKTWVVANVLLQCMEKCYYLIDKLWHFTVNVHYCICITPDPCCILDICLSLREILSFIKGRLCSIGDRDIDCPCCLLTFKHQITAYIKVFQRIRDLNLDSHVSALFNCSLIYLSH